MFSHVSESKTAYSSADCKAEVLMKQPPLSKACHTDWNVLYLLFIQPGSFENYWLWWGVTDTNHVLVDYIADTSFWLYLSVCHNS